MLAVDRTDSVLEALFHQLEELESHRLELFLRLEAASEQRVLVEALCLEVLEVLAVSEDSGALALVELEVDQ